MNSTNLYREKARKKSFEAREIWFYRRIFKMLCTIKMSNHEVTSKTSSTTLQNCSHMLHLIDTMLKNTATYSPSS